MSAAVEVKPDVYGNLIKPGRAGILGMSLGSTIIAAPMVLVMVALVVRQQYLWAFIFFLLSLAAMALSVVRGRDGRNFYERFMLRVAHMIKVRSGNGVYLAGPAGKVQDGSMRLPGLMTASELSDHIGGYDIPFGVVSIPAVGHYTVVLECFPDGDSLVDTDRVNSMVAHWGAWLAELGRTDESIVGASVTVESAPDSGLRLRKMVESNLVDEAPEFARIVAQAIPAQISTGAPELTTRIAVTFSGKMPGSDKDRGLAAMADDIGTRLPVLITGLGQTGAGTGVRVCTAQDIIDFTRTAYDPTVAAQIEEARTLPGGTGLSWEEAGPIFADDRHTDRYLHDRAVSKSWTMYEGPRGQFHSSSLRSLTSPTAGVLRKRVTLLYRPIPAGRATDIVEGDVNNAVFVSSQRTRPTARQAQRRAFAEKAAAEEAQGAGLVRFGMIITVSVADAEQLPGLTKTIPSLSNQARLRIREALGNQAVYFQAGLPLGVVLAEQSMIPPSLRDSL